jgi:hypothetical protein
LGDQQLPTGPDQFSVPTFSATTQRSTDNFSFPLGNDRRSGLVGSTAESWAAFCAIGESQPADAWTSLTVTRPDGSQKVTFKGENLHILIWDIPASTPFPGDLCSEAPGYTGMGRAIITDSDVDLSHRGVDASGLTTTL